MVLPDVSWLNQHEEHLLTVDHEYMVLYRAADVRDTKDGFDVSLVSSAQIPSVSRHEHDMLRCYDLDHSPENFVALGFGNGKLVVGRIEPDSLSTKYFRAVDLRDAPQRGICALSWHFFDPNKLCFAHERGKGADYSVCVYDLNRASFIAQDQPRSLSGVVAEGASVCLYESILTGEKVFDAAWLRDSNLLCVSTMRSLRIGDVREKSGFASTTVVTSPQYGITSEPVHGTLIASHSRNCVSLYDRRLMRAPLRQLSVGSDTQNTVVKLEWHPQRAFSLSCTLSKEQGELLTLSTSPSTFESRNDSELEEMVVRKSRGQADNFEYATLHNSAPNGQWKLGSFSWHPRVADRVALLSSAVSARQIGSIERVHVAELRHDTHCGVSACGEIALVRGDRLDIVGDEILTMGNTADESGKHRPHLTSVQSTPQHDLATVMRTRVAAGYGLIGTGGVNSLANVIESSKRCVESDLNASGDLRFCWHWVDRMWSASLAAESAHPQQAISFPGIKHVAKDLKSVSSTKQDEVSYRNRVARNKILKVCGWPSFEDRAGWRLMFEELMNRGTVQAQARAAALALFSVQGLICKEYLTALSEFAGTCAEDAEFIGHYRTMALKLLDAINRYDGVRVPNYEHLCKALATESYLLAIVKFLARRESYSTLNNEIIMSQGVELEDKIAFAAIHMDDDALNQSLDRMSANLEDENRALSALIITGLDDQPDTHRVIQKYIDSTHDIQTASILLIIGGCFHRSRVLQDPSLADLRIPDLLTRAIDSEPTRSSRRRSLHCCRDYMELLDRWCLWIPKTFLFSFLRQKPNGDTTPTATATQSSRFRQSGAIATQAVIVCNYCSYPIYPTIAERVENLRGPVNLQKRDGKQRVMTCQKCRRPLPKCVICRKHYGSQAEPVNHGDDERPANAPTAIDHWFVWCSTCNHGGHLAHVREWFQEYSICPASGCDCLCMERDYITREELAGSDGDRSRLRRSPSSLLDK